MFEPSQVIVNTPLASLHDIEIAARGCLSSMAYEYVSGGAGDECTLGWNERDWNSIRLRQRVLVDVAELDTSVSLLGRTLSHPILLAPRPTTNSFTPTGRWPRHGEPAKPARR